MIYFRKILMKILENENLKSNDNNETELNKFLKMIIILILCSQKKTFLESKNFIF
jgi:hypothetical protein